MPPSSALSLPVSAAPARQLSRASRPRKRKSSAEQLFLCAPVAFANMQHKTDGSYGNRPFFCTIGSDVRETSFSPKENLPRSVFCFFSSRKENVPLLFFLEEKKQKKINCGAAFLLCSCRFRQRAAQNGRFKCEPSVFLFRAGRAGKHLFTDKSTAPQCLLFLFFKKRNRPPLLFFLEEKKTSPLPFLFMPTNRAKRTATCKPCVSVVVAFSPKKRRKASAFRALPGARRPRWADPAECSAVFRDHPRPVPDGRRTGLAPYSFRAHRRGSPPGSARASRRSRTEYGPGARSYAVSPVRTGIAGSAVASAACSFDSAASASADPVGSRCCCRTSVLLLSLSLGSRRALADRLA